MRTHAEWNVVTHIALARGPTRAATRSFISPAALLVNVIARIWPGCTLRAAEQVGDAVGQDPGLARAGAGDDEQRRSFVYDGGPLLGVEPFEQRARVMGAGC